MQGELIVRETDPAEVPAIESIYPQAFPDEDLLPVVRDLLREDAGALSLTATAGTKVVGHVVFSFCGVSGSRIRAALLGPLAVTPDQQRQGVGTALVDAGMERMKQLKVDLVCVLGDPAYYGRFGFKPEALVEPPYRLPDEWHDAWQSQYLGDSTAQIAAKLVVPPEWQQPALWAP